MTSYKRRRPARKHEVRNVHKYTVFPRELVRNAIYRNLVTPSIQTWNELITELALLNAETAGYQGTVPSNVHAGIQYKGKWWGFRNVDPESPSLDRFTFPPANENITEKLEKLIQDYWEPPEKLYAIHRFLTVLLQKPFTVEILKQVFGKTLYINAFSEISDHWRNLIPEELSQEETADILAFAKQYKSIIDDMHEMALLNSVSF